MITIYVNHIHQSSILIWLWKISLEDWGDRNIVLTFGVSVIQHNQDAVTCHLLLKIQTYLLYTSHLIVMHHCIKLFFPSACSYSQPYI